LTRDFAFEVSEDFLGFERQQREVKYKNPVIPFARSSSTFISSFRVADIDIYNAVTDSRCDCRTVERAPSREFIVASTVVCEMYRCGSRLPIR
jgi:hypothetical protein